MTRPPKVSPPRAAGLFGEAPNQARLPSDVWIANVDGAARGNPGPAAYAVAMRGGSGQAVAELSKYIGRATNNVAEYYGLIAALDYAASQGIAKLHVRSDSELLVRQMKGVYKVKSADLRPLYERARKLASALEYFSIEHVPRELNAHADGLANETLDRTGGSGRPSTPLASAGKSSGDAAGISPGAARVIRARYRGGVIVPESPLDLAEGEEVEISVRPKKRA